MMNGCVCICMNDVNVMMSCDDGGVMMRCVYVDGEGDGVLMWVYVCHVCIDDEY